MAKALKLDHPGDHRLQDTSATGANLTRRNAPTTVMTGNVTQLIIDAVDLAGGASVDASAAIRARMRPFWPPVVSFAGGAVAGAVGFSKFGFGALTLPTALVLYLAIDTRRWANP